MDRICTVPGCGRHRRHRLYCTMHHRRWIKHGDPLVDKPARTIVLIAPGAVCSVEGCEARPKSRGWCSRHYQRWLNHGDPLYTEIIYGDDGARFWSKVDKDGPLPEGRPGLGPCWLWLGSLDHAGYGWFKVGDRMQRAHRWAFSHFVEPAVLDVDHLCFNRACVNYESHLEDVSRLVNNQRRAARLTHCKHGHLLDEANTYLRPGGGRKCRKCMAAAQRAYQSRKRGVAR